MESWVILVIVFVCSCLISFSVCSGVSGGVVYLSNKDKKANQLVENLANQKVQTSDAFKQYLQNSGTINCQEIADKYNVYPPQASIYLSGDDSTLWQMAGCNVYPSKTTMFSNVYGIFQDMSFNYTPYIGKSGSGVSNLANASEKLELRVEPGPKFCVYKNGTLDQCTQGSLMSGTFKLKIEQNGNLCLVDENKNKAWCALSPDLDNSNTCPDATCFNGYISEIALRNAKLIPNINEYRNSHRTARLGDGKFCLYPDASNSSTALWCNK